MDEFEVMGDVVVKKTRLDGDVEHRKVILDKKTFVECYRRWILEEEGQDD